MKDKIREEIARGMLTGAKDCIAEHMERGEQADVGAIVDRQTEHATQNVNKLLMACAAGEATPKSNVVWRGGKPTFQQHNVPDGWMIAIDAVELRGVEHDHRGMRLDVEVLSARLEELPKLDTSKEWTELDELIADLADDFVDSRSDDEAKMNIGRIISAAQGDMAERLSSACIDLKKLRERYEPRDHDIPKCHICGEEMSIGMMGQGRIEWSCYGKVEDGEWNEYKPGRSRADRHCIESHRVTVPRGDLDVVRLVDLLLGITESEADQ